MKTSFVTLAFVAGLVAAQQGSIPTCAQPCVQAITSGDSIGGCKALDVKCICTKGSLLDNLACCLEDKCDEAGKEAAVKYAAQICGSAGVTDIPTAVTCQKQASETGSSSSKTESETKSAAAASETTKTEDHTTKTESHTGSETGSHHTTGTATAADQASKTSESSSKTSSTGMANGLNAPVGMVGAAVLGLLAL